MTNPIAPISLTGPPAILALLALWWYYNRLNRSDVPRSRRKIRQVSIVVMVVEIALLLVGTSLTDHRLQQERFVWVWLAAIVLLVVVMAIMIVDALNSMLISRRTRREVHRRLMSSLRRAEEEFRHRQRPGMSVGTASHERELAGGGTEDEAVEP